MNALITLREKVINILKEVSPDPDLIKFIGNKVDIALVAFPKDTDLLIRFSKAINSPAYESSDQFVYTTLVGHILDEPTIADPRGLLVAIPYRFNHLETHRIGFYRFIKLGDAKTVNLQKTTITL
jgi:hypothetical protein